MTWRWKFFSRGQNNRGCRETKPSETNEKSPNTVCKLFHKHSESVQTCEPPFSSLGENSCRGKMGRRWWGSHVCSSPLCGFCSANQTTCLKDSGIRELSASSSHSTYSRSSLWQSIQWAVELKTLSIHNTVQPPLPPPSANLRQFFNPTTTNASSSYPSYALFTTAEPFFFICLHTARLGLNRFMVYY